MALQQVKNSNRRFPLSSPINKQALEQTTQRFGEFLLNYWANVLTIVLGMLVATALAIPFLSYFGLDAIAKPLFFALHYVCAQVPSHSLSPRTPSSSMDISLACALAISPSTHPCS